MKSFSIVVSIVVAIATVGVVFFGPDEPDGYHAVALYTGVDGQVMVAYATGSTPGEATEAAKRKWAFTDQSLAAPIRESIGFYACTTMEKTITQVFLVSEGTPLFLWLKLAGAAADKESELNANLGEGKGYSCKPEWAVSEGVFHVFLGQI